MLREVGQEDAEEDDTGDELALLFVRQRERCFTYIEREKLRKPGDARALQWGDK